MMSNLRPKLRSHFSSHFLVLTIGLLALLAACGRTESPPVALKRCVAGLEFLAKGVEQNSNARVSARWLRANLGRFEATHDTNRFGSFSDLKEGGSAKDLAHCEQVGISTRELGVYFSAISGDFGEDPVDKLAACSAAVSVTEQYLYSNLGAQKGASIVSELTNMLGTTFVDLKVIYDQDGMSAVDFEEIAAIKIQNIYSKSPDQRPAALEKAARSCAAFEIPMARALNAAFKN